MLRSLLTSKRSSLLSLLLVVALAAASGAPLFAQSSGQIFYVYDNLGRLVGVVDQQGNAATYNYDAVGNILSIERFNSSDIPGQIGITLVSPAKGKVGTPVAIFGKGFGATPAENSVSFNGAPGAIVSATANRIVTTVPAGATTGPVTVIAPLGSATSPTAFRVLGAITVTPTTAALNINNVQQFAAQESAIPTANVIWSVNALVGGESAVGTISSQGLYTAPARISSLLTVTITATHKDDPTLSASASVTIVPPPPVFLASRNVTIGFAEPPPRVERNVTTSVSVSVTSQAAPATGVAPFVAVTREPVITSVSPPSGARGSTNLLITLTGAGFSGATELSFLLNNSADSSITASTFIISPDGTQATAEISITAGAGLGARVVRIGTPGATSTAAGTGGNLFTVQE